jgi:hypothetical protein
VGCNDFRELVRIDVGDIGVYYGKEREDSFRVTDDVLYEELERRDFKQLPDLVFFGRADGSGPLWKKHYHLQAP